MDNPSVRRWSSRFRGTNLRFRYKVMLGVGVAVAISFFAGANAIFNVRRVEQSVTFSSEAASPLLIGVISLSESYQKLQSVFDPVTRNCAGLEGATRYFATSQAEQKSKLQSLMKMALEAKALKELKRYEFSGQKIFRTRQALLDLCHDYTSARSAFSSAENSIRLATNVIGLSASTSVFALEQRVADLWRKRNAPMPRGTLADYDLGHKLDDEIAIVWRQIRNFYKIRVLVTELAGAGAIIADATRQFELDRRRRSYMTKLRAFEHTVNDARPYYERIGRGPEFAGLTAMVKQTRLMFDESPRALFRSAALLGDIERRRLSLVERLQREQGQYSVALLNIMDVAQRINRRAQIQSETPIGRAGKSAAPWRRSRSSCCLSAGTSRMRSRVRSRS